MATLHSAPTGQRQGAQRNRMRRHSSGKTPPNSWSSCFCSSKNVYHLHYVYCIFVKSVCSIATYHQQLESGGQEVKAMNPWRFGEDFRDKRSEEIFSPAIGIWENVLLTAQKHIYSNWWSPNIMRYRPSSEPQGSTGDDSDPQDTRVDIIKILVCVTRCVVRWTNKPGGLLFFFLVGGRDLMSFAVGCVVLNT